MAKEMFAGYATVYTAGQPVVLAVMGEAAAATFVPLMLLVLLILDLSFRRLSYMLLPLLTVVKRPSGQAARCPCAA